MSFLLLATLIGCASAANAPCDKGTDCGPHGVCVAQRCRTGGERAAVALLATVAVPHPVMHQTTPGLRARALEIARRLERGLAWTGFYDVLPVNKHPRAPQRVRMSDPTRAVWRGFGVNRVLRLFVGHGLGHGGLSVRAELVNTATGEVLLLSAGAEHIPPGGDRHVVARWINGLVGYDTGLPSSLGSRILVSVQVSRGRKEIAVVESDGSGLFFLTRNGSINVAPTWGPGGDVGYMSYLRRNTDWVVNGRPFSTRPGLNAAGDWSPDGKTLALCVSEGGNSEIVLLDAQTGEERLRLTHDPGVDTSPAWSPDGGRIAFVSDRTGSPQIWIHDLHSGRQERLNDGGYTASPVWSPLGDTLVYTQLIAGQAILIRRDLDTGHLERLTEPGTNAESPTISPDGRYVVFVRRTEQSRSALWRLPVRGGVARPLAQQAWPLYAPDWQY